MNSSALLKHVMRHALRGVCVGVLIGVLDLIHVTTGTVEGFTIFEADEELSFVSALLWTVCLPATVSMLVCALQWLTFTALHTLHRRCSTWAMWGAVTAYSALWSHPWHQTVLQGDGITAHENYVFISWTLWVAMTVLVTLVHGLSIARLRYELVWGASSIFGLSFSALMFPNYPHFHAYLIVWSVWSMGAFFWVHDSAKGKKTKAQSRAHGHIVFALSSLLLVGVMGFFVWHTYAYRKSIKMLNEELLMVRFIARHEPLRLFRDPGDGFGLQALTSLQRREAHEEIKQHQRAYGVTGAEHKEARRAKAKHVVIVVLESMRAERWNDPNIAPRFATWSKQGAYFPRAVAQYPATPLAYGAMFLSQTPYVLVHSPYWASGTPLSHLHKADVFERTYLSRPENHWFDQSAITGFLLGPGTQADVVHTSTPEGLEGLRLFLQDTYREGVPSLSWLHIYDAHSPYELHSSVRQPQPGEPPSLAAYLSEVGYVDDALGEFMAWYFTHPIHHETLILVIGDHGEALGDVILGRSYWGHHVHVHASLAHIPLVSVQRPDGGMRVKPAAENSLRDDVR